MEKNYFVSKEEYLAVKANWKKSESHTAWEMIVYNILRGKDPKHGFCEKKKHIQGNDPWFAYGQALWWAKLNLRRLNSASFEAKFGIATPLGLMEKLK